MCQPILHSPEQSPPGTRSSAGQLLSQEKAVWIVTSLPWDTKCPQWTLGACRGWSILDVQNMTKLIYLVQSLQVDSTMESTTKHTTTTKKPQAFIFFGARCNQPHLLFSSSQGADSSVISCSCPPASSFLSCWSAQLLSAIPTSCSFSRPSPQFQQPWEGSARWGFQLGSPNAGTVLQRTTTPDKLHGLLGWEKSPSQLPQTLQRWTLSCTQAATKMTDLWLWNLWIPARGH